MPSPAFAYNGGKAKLRGWILDNLPEHGSGRFVEPFAGKGNVMWEVLHRGGMGFSGFWLNDLKTYRLFDLLKGTPPDELRAIVGEKEPNMLDHRWCRANRKHPKALLLESFMTFGGGGWGTGYKSSKRGNWAGYVSKLAECHRLLNGFDVRVTNWDYRRVLRHLSSRDMAYLDPPYLGADVNSYDTARYDPVAMCDLLTSKGFAWSLSEYRHKVYVSRLGEPTVTKGVKVHMTRTVSRSTGAQQSQSGRVECLWTRGRL